LESISASETPRETLRQIEIQKEVRAKAFASIFPRKALRPSPFILETHP
jgi:hypothetical protein